MRIVIEKVKARKMIRRKTMWMGLLSLLCLFVAFQTKAADSDVRPIEEKIAARLDNLQKLIFRNDDDRVPQLFERYEFKFTTLVSSIGTKAHEITMFDLESINVRLRGGGAFYITGTNPTDYEQAEVTIVLSEETLQKSYYTERVVAGSSDLRWEDERIFDNKCLISRLYRGGRLLKTLVGINIQRLRHWNIVQVEEGSEEPAACMVAGIAAHIGLRNITSLNPKEIIRISQMSWGGRVRFVQSNISDALMILYKSGIKEGMTQKEARETVIKFFKDNDAAYKKKLKEDAIQ